MKQKSNLKELKDRNKKLILRQLIDKGPLSRTELSQYTGLSMTAVSDLVDELIKQNLIKEGGIGISTGGRRPIMLELNPESGYIMVFKVSEDKISAMLFNFSLTKIIEKESRFDYFEVSKLERKIKEIYFSIEKEFCAENKRIFGIGICLNKDVKALKPRGILTTSVSADFMTLEQSLSLELGIPVIEEDEIKLKALAEYKKLQLGNNLIYLKIDEETIESSVVINGRYLENDINIGHMIVDKNGPLCSDGPRGCLNALVSVKAILKRALIMMIEEHGKEEINIPSLDIDNLGEILNDDKKTRLLNEISDYLKIAIINLKNLLDIKTFIIDGKILKFSELINILAKAYDNVIIKKSSTRDEDVMRETAKLALKKIIHVGGYNQ
ncbi:MAG TPA: ROK family transcriptional regulator [Clostridia bacterium]|nr:ROK family transcriptional regulator [Clostridia bacterium]